MSDGSVQEEGAQVADDENSPSTPEAQRPSKSAPPIKNLQAKSASLKDIFSLQEDENNG